ncbi:MULTISPECIES: hypothetical protein [Bradyrhizobium]|uniref:hypothetical protein n=1 Tax=Bradyrhizobium TaxID=374 RepID=UPI0019568FEC|nr:hypothetical protein [Bradyrhizobium canariense]MBM7485923.1 hypothetical protein [Bradyrhizobium canariense]
MIEDVLIWKFVAEHQPLHKSQLESSIAIVCNVALVGPCTGLYVSRLTNAVMLNEQLETVSALIAPGAFQPPEISLPHGLQI